MSSVQNQKHFRVCNLCEAMCGLEIEHDGEKVIKIRGDQKDPFSKGSICPKGANYGSLHEDPDRLRTPIKRTHDGWKEISYEEAFDEIEEKINGIRSEHGNDTVALYLGNPTVHNFGFMMYVGELKKALNTKNSFSPTSMDQLPHHFAAYFTFGHPMLIPIPDIDNTDYMIIMGANPYISNGSIMSSAGVQSRLKSIKDRGGKYLVIDPRKNETAKTASEHHFIRPSTDVFFLLAMLHVILREDYVNLGHLESEAVGFEKLKNICEEFAPEKVAVITGIASNNIIRITAEYCAAEKAILYGRIGVSTQEHGGLCHWLINVINIVTGHFDREGGAMLTLPAVDIIRGKEHELAYGRWKSRVSQLPEFDGELPVSVMAEEMLTEGEGQIKGLITNAGNPVLSTPNGTQLEKALIGLDFMVSIDIYLNETTKHADIIIPPPFGLEVDHYDLIFNAIAVRNNAKFSKALFKPKKGMLYDWEIAKELIKRFSKSKVSFWQKISTPTMMLKLALLFGPYGNFSKLSRLFNGLNLRKINRSVHGIDLGPLRPRIPEALRTPDSKIHLADDVFIERMKDVAREFSDMKIVRDQFLLIGGRQLKNNNSWMHNVDKLIAGKNRCTVHISTEDAKKMAVSNDQDVRVKSSRGEIVLPALVNDDIMPGVISIPHGFGHNRQGSRITVAEAHAGVSVNDITDHSRIDKLTGNAAFSGQTVEVSPV